MAIEIKVPDIGADEAEIIEILVKMGDKVEAERPLITVEGDKASMEIPSPRAGIAKGVKVFAGDKTQTGALTMIFDSADGAADAVSTQAKEKKEAAPAVAPAAATAKDVNAPGIDSDEAEVTEILVKVGDKVEAKQSLITVKGDKASMEVPALFVGTVKEVKVNVNDKMSIGSLTMIFEVVGEAGATAPATKQETAPVAAPTSTTGVKEVNIPDIGGDEVEVAEVMVKMGDKVAAEQLPITVEGDKASMEALAPFTGVVRELKVNVGDKVKTGSLIIIFEVENTAPVAAPAKQEAAAPAPAARAKAPAAAPTTKAGGKFKSAENDTYIHMTPLIHRPTREFGVSLAKMKGTGRRGRILCEDIQVYVKEAIRCAEAAPAVTGGGAPGMLLQPKVDLSKFGEIEEMELGCIQKISGANLSCNWVVIPHVTHLDKADITGLEALRKRQNEETVKRKLDAKITSVVSIMKAAAVALEQMPRLSGSLSEDGQRLILKKYTNVGVAMGTPNGLVVPIFKGANKGGIIELSRELIAISKKACDGKLTAGEIQGGCLTISSIDGLGTIYFAPIVNAPEVAILDVSKSMMESVWNDKEFVPRLMLPISFSFDHRMIDGVDGTRFTTIVNNTLSDIRHLVM